LKKSFAISLSKKQQQQNSVRKRNDGQTKERTFHEGLPRYEEAAMLGQWKALGIASTRSHCVSPKVYMQWAQKEI
jgi:hypothetical protein